ncbi:MAG TPA: DUF3501 family protein [Acidimicrobiales bacterium]|nr:DUF3501 family protein [Acidimicrobiales bacterium]
MAARPNATLTLDDIADARAYERERQSYRERIIALKKLRRVAVGPVVSFVFENRDTIRFQVQEMARAEKLYSDEAILGELDTYNPLIPEKGHLSATMFLELTSRAEMEHWLPRLVGIEQTVKLLLPSGDSVLATVEGAHAAQLTRDEVTASVHYVNFSFNDEQIRDFQSGLVALALDHPEYRHQTALSDATKGSLSEDLLG